MSSKQETESIRISQVVAGALAAVTAALLGSTMGVAGTVVGAGLASVVSTVGGALYLRSLERTGESVRVVRNRVVARAGSTVVSLPPEPPEPPDGQEAGTGGDESEPRAEEAPPSAGPAGRRRARWPALVAGGVLAFMVGMVMVTGLEWVRGEPLSGGGQGTTFGQIVGSDRAPVDDGGDRDDRAPATRESTPASEENGPDGDGPAGEDPGATPTGTATSTPGPSDEPEEPDTSDDPSTPEQTPPTSTPGGEPTGSVPAPPSGNVG